MRILTFLLACSLSTAAWGQEGILSRNSNLRSGPSTASKIIGHLQAGASVTIVSKYPRVGWVRVQTADSKTGWIVQRNLTPDTQGSGNGTPAGGPTEVVSGTVPARAGDASIYPNPQLTPGKGDPTVTQANIGQNICNKSWSTGDVRPATSVTNKIKVDTLKAYGFTDAANHYELDHLLSLQNGGCPDCVENLWPEAYGDPRHPMTQNQRAAWNKAHPGSTDTLPGALEKDLVENHIHDEICFGIPDAKLSMFAKKYPATVKVALTRAQEILATDWYGCYQNMMDGNKPCQ